MSICSIEKRTGQKFHSKMLPFFESVLNLVIKLTFCAYFRKQSNLSEMAVLVVVTMFLKMLLVENETLKIVVKLNLIR